MIIAINASNILSYGGLIHLKNIISYARPKRDKFSKIILWAPKKIFSELPDKKWLEKRDEKELGSNLINKLLNFNISKVLNKFNCDILFNLNGYNLINFTPNVLIIQNQVPFELNYIFKYYSFKKIIRLILLRILMLSSIKKSNGVIFLSKYSQMKVQKNFTNFIINKKIIPHGVNNIFFHSKKIFNQKNIFNIKNPIKFIYVSSLEPYKNHKNLLLAFQKLIIKQHPVHLTIIGDGEDRDVNNLLSLIKKINRNHNFIKYIKKIDNEKLLSYYKNADVSIYPSECETFGISLVESMAASLPVLSSNRFPMKEFVGNKGIFFNPNNPKDIALKVIYFIKNFDKRKNLSKIMYKRAKKYNWNLTTIKTFSFLNDVYKQIK